MIPKGTFFPLFLKEAIAGCFSLRPADLSQILIDVWI